MGKIELIDADTLYFEPIQHPKMLVDGLLSTGLAVLSGDAKIGKSWMVLLFCLQIAKGEPVWGIPTAKSDVVYLALEDRSYRIQDRMHSLTDDPPKNLRFGFTCGMLGAELEEELRELLEENPGTGIIFIDTFQKVRDNVSGKTNAYAKDYQDLGALKKIADDHEICIFLVHHNRKERDSSNVLHDITGSTGIAGVADTIMVLRKEEHFSNDAVLSITGRDVEERRIKLTMKKNIWEATEELRINDEPTETVPAVIHHLTRFFLDYTYFIGNMTDFLSAIGDTITSPNVAGKMILKYYDSILKPLGIEYEPHRCAGERLFRIARNDKNDDNDGNDEPWGIGKSSSYEAKYMALMAGNDGQLTLPDLSSLSSLPSQPSPKVPEYDPVSKDFIPFKEVTPDVECPFISNDEGPIEGTSQVENVNEKDNTCGDEMPYRGCDNTTMTSFSQKVIPEPGVPEREVRPP